MFCFSVFLCSIDSVLIDQSVKKGENKLRDSLRRRHSNECYFQSFFTSFLHNTYRKINVMLFFLQKVFSELKLLSQLSLQFFIRKEEYI